MTKTEGVTWDIDRENYKFICEINLGPVAHGKKSEIDVRGAFDEEGLVEVEFKDSLNFDSSRLVWYPRLRELMSILACLGDPKEKHTKKKGWK